ncbi:MAG: tetratricopeptide repeat protein [Lachnospiraceae bacterium]|nr:tetratricopeptide repeat protein [Lachnospiraceae bacterium]
MQCYNCGCTLSEKDFCTACGADVSVYKKIIGTSNRFYNDGLEKAGVRDLSGAVNSLRQSLKFNKNNIEARNLLGLVYFEMGEAVAALSEWVISKNLRPNKNIADDYLNMIQSNQGRLDTLNQTIKKYNQALAYCHQESLDLAVIQLKKVLSLNPNFIRAHQLLALLYINQEDWEKARRELIKCQKIDANNTTTLRYMKEVDAMLAVTENGRGKEKKKKDDDVIKYQSGNETIIQPVGTRESSGVSTLLNMGIGIVIGIAIACFLILPARLKTADSAVREELRKVSEQNDLKTANIAELEQKIAELTQNNTDIQSQLDHYEGTDGTMEAIGYLMDAVNAYLTNPEDISAVSQNLEKIGAETVENSGSKAFIGLYEKLLETVGPTIAESYYDTGYDSYRREMYDEAIPNLQKAVEFDPANGDALLYLGNCYRNTGKKEEATKIYEQVVSQFEGTEKARKAQSFLNEMKEE